MQTVIVLFEEAVQILNALQLLQISDLPEGSSLTVEQIGQLANRLEESITKSQNTESQKPFLFPVVAQVAASTNTPSSNQNILVQNILVMRRIHGRVTDNIVVAQRTLDSAPFEDEIAYLNTDATPAGMSAIRALAQLIEE